MNTNLEELITALYDMIQDAKSVPLSSDKCMIEREKALDMLDDLSAQLPSELKQARTIVQSREELVSQARREAETIIRNARAEAAKLVEQEAIYQQALAKCQEMATQTRAQLDQEMADHQKRMDQLKAVTLGYVGDSLTETEKTILKTLEDVRNTRSRFQAIAASAPAAPAGNQFDQDL